jgi:hypothetical protein
MTMELPRVGVWNDGNSPKFIITFPTAANPQQIGVRNPTRIEPPVRTTIPPIHPEVAVS